jgi:hypothetical protein
MKKNIKQFVASGGGSQVRNRNRWLGIAEKEWILMALIIAMLMPAFLCHAQNFRATITGTVTDPSGAVIPGAHVTATNASTGVRSSGVANARGLYVIPYLNPGPYQITVEANGFQRFERSGITLTVAQRLKLDFKLLVGSVHQTISVSGAAPLLNTTSAVSGVTISERSIRQLPQADGNPYAFDQLSAGIVYYGSHQFQRAVDQDTTASIRVNGAPGPNQFTINGAPEDVSTGNYEASRINNQGHAQGETNGTQNTFEAFIPPKDAVQEFQIESGRYSAQYGHTAGGNINVVLKSGTNALHGDFYEFNRNSALFTDTFFAKATGAPKSQLQYNRYGGSIGGPVYIPKIYNGKNRTFFFFAYQGLKQSSPNPSFYTVPTQAERQGDFSALQSQGVTIYNPYSATATPNGLIERQPFPNNVIPANYLSSQSAQIAQNILKWYPMPNRSGNQYGEDNFFSQGQNTDNYNSELVRIDETISNRNRISFDWFRNFRKGQSGWSGNINGINPTARGITRPVQGVGYEQTYTFNPSTVLDVSLGVVSRVETHFLGSQGVATPSSLGFPASTVSLFQGGQFLPQIQASGLSTLSSGGPDFQRAMVYSLEPSLMKVIGNHDFHIGYDYRVFRLGSESQVCIAGCYNFGTNFTNGPFNTSGSEFGQGIAALLLGQPTGGQENVNGSFNDQMLYNAFYVQDNWTVNPRLTLNLGLRYGVEGAVTERHNRNTRGFDLTTPNPIQAAAQAAYAANPPVAGGSIQPPSLGEFKVLGGVTYADSKNRNIYNADRNNFQPRVGVAYALDSKSVIHAGWGLFMVPHNFIGLNEPGYNQNTSLVPSQDNGLTFQANLANPFPSGIVAPSGSSLGLKTSLGQGVSYFPLNQRNGMAQEWEFDVQQQLGQHWVADLAYVGNHGADLLTGTQLDALPKQYLSTQPTRDTTVINDLSTTEPNPFEGLAPGSGLNGSKTNLYQLLLPYPQFTSIGSNRFDGTSDYNSLQVTVQRRFNDGFSMISTYTWSKLMESDILLNPQDTNYTRSVSPTDTPQRFIFSGIWEIPVGRGRKFGRRWHGPLNATLGGWQGQWIYTLSSGTPILFSNDIYYNGNPNSLRATINGGTVLKGTFPINNFYPGGVADPNSQAIRLADHYRTFPYVLPHFRTQAINNADLELMKRFNLGKGRDLQVHADFLNAFNHPLFNAPDMSPTSGEFSKVTSQANFPRNIQLGAWFNF